ncbi:hypothetical protein FZEAL_7383 [Fusarium zealandicum]|uniref:Uncharacterized protein n=1 Tax=Fusarium zealandicum TaxID=1053134 RepID=A0A8H4UGN3_9HYPO|nr:hypothetical protein FZEAL_7383 [Fusarium zealandicum]
MLRSFCVLAGCLAAASFSAPLQKRDIAAPAGGDDAILNYALALEYLERKFYEEGIQRYTEQQFADAGFDATFYANLLQIYDDEKTHVDFLSSALGDKAIGEPTFVFPHSDVHSFLGLSSVLEGVGVSAYLGAALAIAEKEYLTAAGSILNVEARHASYIRSSLGQNPFPAAFDTPLDFNQGFSLAAQFVTGLAEGTVLPFKAFCKLEAVDPSGKGYWPGGTVVFPRAHMNAQAAGKGDGEIYAVFYSGLQSYYVPVTMAGDDYTVIIPGTNYAAKGQPAPAGQVYITLTTADGSEKAKASDENTIAGVVVIEVVSK